MITAAFITPDYGAVLIVGFLLVFLGIVGFALLGYAVYRMGVKAAKKAEIGQKEDKNATELP